MKLSVIIPAYNEAGTIREIIRRVKNAEIGSIEKEIIVVDDGSTDQSREILNSINGIKVVHHAQNSGKGSAVRTGIANSSGDIILIQDADLEYNPNEYMQLITPILERRAKVVYGSRRLNKKNRNAGLKFMIGGISLSWITSILFFAKISDEPTGYKVFHKDVFKLIQIVGQRFEWEPEITAKILRDEIDIEEVPISYAPRTVKEGKKIKLSDWVIAVWTLLKYRFVV